MIRRWYDIDTELALLDEMRRRMDRLFGGGGTWVMPTAAAAWPRTNVIDGGESLVVELEVPGVSDKSLKIEGHQDVLTVSGERMVEAPKGYRTHRAERGSRTFTRSTGLPVPVDLEKTTATLKDGILTVTMRKHPEAQPRQITVSTE